MDFIHHRDARRHRVPGWAWRLWVKARPQKPRRDRGSGLAMKGEDFMEMVDLALAVQRFSESFAQRREMITGRRVRGVKPVGAVK